MEDEGRQVMAIAHLAFWPGETVTTFDHTRTIICDVIIYGVTFEKLENIFKHCGYIH
jgi:hypothetical protein